jgi:hypothetical protein
MYEGVPIREQRLYYNDVLLSGGALSQYSLTYGASVLGISTRSFKC